MTNLEKLQTGTEEEVKIILMRLAYRSNNYTSHDKQVERFMKEEVRINCHRDVVL